MLERLAAVAALALAACTTSPPPSQLPNAQAAIDRMRATSSCGNAIQADAKLDHFSSETGRIRTELLFIAARPARLRMDALAPVVGTVFTLTTNGSQFEVSDLRNHRFLHGPATACNIARITNIPMPIHPLITLLMGRAPVLRHDAQGLPAPTITWDGSGSGHYVVKIAGNNDAVEEVQLAPDPSDWKKPWGEQRLRVLDVTVSQRGVVLYHAELDSHETTPMATPATANGGATAASDCDEVCKALGQTATPRSGGTCDAEIPRRIHVEIPTRSTDALFRYDKVAWNPPLDPAVFSQQPQSGLSDSPVECE